MAAALIGNWEYYFLPLPLRVLNLPTLANLWVPHHLLLVPLIPPTPLQLVPSLKIPPQLDTVSPWDPESYIPLSHIALTCTDNSNAQRNTASLKQPQSQTHGFFPFNN